MTTQARELAKLVSNAGDVNLGDDISLASDGAILNFGADNDVTLTHVADTGLLLNSSRKIQFGDSGTWISQSADGVLNLTSDTEVEINATTVDINANVDISGNLVLGGNITIGDADSDSLTLNADLTSHLIPNATNTYDLGTASKEWRNAYFDGTVTSDAFAGPLTGNVTGNVSGTAATVTGAAQTNITSLGTLTALTVQKASSGASATAGTVVTIEDDDNTELSLLGGSSSLLAINFGHSGDADDGIITYNTSSGAEAFGFTVDGGVDALYLSAEDVIINNGSVDMNFRVESNGNANMLFVDGGNDRVGIGYGSPAATLDIRTTHTETDVTAANTNSTLIIGNTGSGNGVYNSIKFAGNQQDMYMMSVNHGTQASRRIGFFVGSVAGDATGDERLSILGDGKVGIGVTAPTTYLDVRAPSGVAGPNVAYFKSDQHGLGVYINVGSTFSEIRANNNSYPLVLNASSGGNVGIGTTSPASHYGFGKTFEVQGSANAEINISQTDNSKNWSLGIVNNSNYQQTDNSQYIWEIGGSEELRLDGDGVKFNGDTAAANALDDYEEGSWTPTCTTSNSDGSFSVTVNYAKYIKVGGLVHASCYLSINISNIGSGAAMIAGLPFPATSGQGYNLGIVAHASAVAAQPSNGVSAYVTNGQSNVRMVGVTDAGNPPWVAGNPKYLMIDVTYHHV